MAKKATNYEIILRVTRIIDFVLDGLSRYEIVQFGSKEWGITNRQVDDYIAYANKRISRMAEKIEEQSFNRIRNRLERQYRRAIQKGDGMLASQALDWRYAQVVFTRSSTESSHRRRRQSSYPGCSQQSNQFPYLD